MLDFAIHTHTFADFVIGPIHIPPNVAINLLFANIERSAQHTRQHLIEISTVHADPVLFVKHVIVEPVLYRVLRGRVHEEQSRPAYIAV